MKKTLFVALFFLMGFLMIEVFVWLGAIAMVSSTSITHSWSYYMDYEWHAIVLWSPLATGVGFFTGIAGFFTACDLGF